MYCDSMKVIALKPKFKELSESGKVSVINAWAEKNHDEQIYWLDDYFIESSFSGLSIVEAFHEFCGWGDIFDCWIKSNGYGNWQEVDEYDMDELIDDILDNCGDDISFQSEVSEDDWDYEASFKEALCYKFSENDTPDDTSPEVIDALNNEENKQRFIDEECDSSFNGDEYDARDEYVFWVIQMINEKLNNPEDEEE